MLEQKDIIKLLNPIKATLHIGYKAPHSDYESVLLDSGTVLQISPYCELGDDEYRFNCLEKDIPTFKVKYFPNSQYNDEYYEGFSLFILKLDLENKYEIIEKADLTKLDFTKNEDRAIFVRQVWASHKKIQLLPNDLQVEFKAIIKQYEDGEITSNEVFNYHLYAIENYYTKKT